MRILNSVSEKKSERFNRLPLGAQFAGGGELIGVEFETLLEPCLSSIVLEIQ